MCWTRLGWTRTYTTNINWLWIKISIKFAAPLNENRPRIELFLIWWLKFNFFLLKNDYVQRVIFFRNLICIGMHNFCIKIKTIFLKICKFLTDPTWTRAAFIECRKTKTKTTTMVNHNANANDATNENTKQTIRNLRKARENARDQVTIGFGFWLVE